MSDPFGIHKKADEDTRYGVAGAAIGGAAAGVAMEPQDRVRRNRVVRAKAAEKAQSRRLQERSGKVPKARLDVEAGKLLRRKADVSAARKAKYLGRITPGLGVGLAAAGGAMLADDMRQRQVKKSDPFELSKGNVRALGSTESYVRTAVQRAKKASDGKAATDAVSGPRKATSSRVSEAWAGKTSEANTSANSLRSSGPGRRNLYLVGGATAGAGAAGAGGTVAYRRNQR